LPERPAMELGRRFGEAYRARLWKQLQESPDWWRTYSANPGALDPMQIASEFSVLVKHLHGADPPRWWREWVEEENEDAVLDEVPWVI
jgi:hypothetical protein